MSYGSLSLMLTTVVLLIPLAPPRPRRRPWPAACPFGPGGPRATGFRRERPPGTARRSRPGAACPAAHTARDAPAQASVSDRSVCDFAQVACSALLAWGRASDSRPIPIRRLAMRTDRRLHLAARYPFVAAP